MYKWMFQLDDGPNLNIENDCFTKHPFINGCSGFQAVLGGGLGKMNPF